MSFVSFAARGDHRGAGSASLEDRGEGADCSREPGAGSGDLGSGAAARSASSQSELSCSGWSRSFSPPCSSWRRLGARAADLVVWWDEATTRSMSGLGRSSPRWSRRRHLTRGCKEACRSDSAPCARRRSPLGPARLQTHSVGGDRSAIRSGSSPARRQVPSSRSDHGGCNHDLTVCGRDQDRQQGGSDDG